MARKKNGVVRQRRGHGGQSRQTEETKPGLRNVTSAKHRVETEPTCPVGIGSRGLAIAGLGVGGSRTTGDGSHIGRSDGLRFFRKRQAALRRKKAKIEVSPMSRYLTCMIGILLLASAATGRDQASLGDLTVPASRVPDWYVAPDGGIPDLATWTRIDVTSAAEMGAIGCAPASSANGSSDRAALQCAIDQAPDSSILDMPPGTYNLASNEGLVFRSRIVLRGAGQGTTIVQKAGRGGWVAGTCRSYSTLYFVGSQGAQANWTGGYTRGTTTIFVDDTSAFSTGDFAYLHMDNDASVLDNPSNSDPKFEPIVKIAAVDTGASALVLDRPLRLNYTARPSGRRIRKIQPTHNAGIEGFTFKGVGQTEMNKAVCLYLSVNNWVRDVEFVGHHSKAVDIVHAGRNAVVNSYFHDPSRMDPVNNYQIDIVTSSTDNLIAGNVFQRVSSAVVLSSGPIGTIVAYNYFDGCDRRGVFHHGGYPSETLVEGNDSNCPLTLDNYWGRQGERITFFRNRLRDQAETPGTNISAIQIHADTGSHPMAHQTNVLLNHSQAYYGLPGCRYNDGTCFAYDKHYDQAVITDAWVERNIARDDRDTAMCTGNNTPWDCCWGPATGSCSFGLTLDNPATRCGPGGPLEACDEYNAEGVGRSPSSWDVLRFPDSLVAEWNSSGARPVGWCQESPWPATGADVDDWGQPRGKIPAERRLNGDPCTQFGTPPGLAVPTAPILLD